MSTARARPCSFRARAHRASAALSPGASLAAGPEPAVVARRAVLSLLPLAVALPAVAKGRLKPPPESEFLTLPPFEWRGSQHEGLRYADLVVGRGAPAAAGKVLTLHFECRYRGLVALSSREARLLGGNRTLAEPFSFSWPGGAPPEMSRPRLKRTRLGLGLELKPAGDDTADAGLFIVTDVTPGGPASRGGVRPLDRLLSVNGAPAAGLSPQQLSSLLAAGDAAAPVDLSLRAPGEGPRSVSLLKAPIAQKSVSQSSGDSSSSGGGGLFTGTAGPRPPPALWLAVGGMRTGGRRTVLVPTEVGYDDAGINEIPPNEPFSLDIELLSVKDD